MSLGESSSWMGSGLLFSVIEEAGEAFWSSEPGKRYVTIFVIFQLS